MTTRSSSSRGSSASARDRRGFTSGPGRTVKRHRAEIRALFGFRECTVADAEELAGWLAGGYAQEERRYELVRDEEITAEEIREILKQRPGQPGLDLASALRSLFQALKQERLIFRDPTRGITMTTVVRLPVPIPPAGSAA
ncbi:MAG: hypothetical protein ACRDOH_09575 [Streptosporangiaceae bacterium]